ncbi:FRIGIDA-like protein 3 [Hordeum vulgare subsp. vulgare]|uniref:FRIGIDA-like protein n=1 Tax=Hordeum vulgare subsp. vulgare TaxID=112509 RepID=A0A8I6X481_HORVV|nr:FRIGIDA-like protein 3 [Hordeum vulgare subsp. vulgare]
MAAERQANPSVLDAVASLQTYSTALSAFTSAWRSLYSDATTIDSTLASRLEGFSQLELLCSAMDGPGLRAYLSEHRDELREPARALDAALLVAPDPGLLVLAAAAGFCRAPPDNGKADAESKVSCRLLIDLLDRIRALGVKPSPEALEEARAVAADWRRSKRIEAQSLFKNEAIAFLLLIGVFGLVEDVGGAVQVLDLVVSISSRERAVEIFLGLGLDLDKHLPVLTQAMISKGKQLDAVKFIQALNLVHKYPLLPILRSYVNDAKNAGNMIRIRGGGPASQDAGDAKERTLLGALQKFIKEHNLEELPISEEANNRMTQLDLQSAERKRAANAAAAAAREVSKNILDFRKRPQLAENAVQGSLGQNIRPVGTLGQQLMLRQNIPAVGVANKYQAVSSHSVLPAIAHNPLLPAGNQRPTGIQTQTLAASSVQAQYSGVADFYNLASIRPGGLSVPGGSTSSRSKLYSEDPLVYVSRASDKKGSSYSYSLSNMSKYNP